MRQAIVMNRRSAKPSKPSWDHAWGALMQLEFWKRPPWRRYVAEMRDALDRWAVWWPGDFYEPGDFGVLSQNRFVKRGSILSFAASDIRTHGPRRSLEMLEIGRVASEGGRARTDASVSGVASVSARLEVADSRGVFLRAGGLSYRWLDDDGLRRALHTARSEVVWDAGWRVVKGVTSADKFSLIVGSTPTGAISVRGAADAIESLGAGTLNSEAGLSVTGKASLRMVGRSGPIFLDLIDAKIPVGPVLGSGRLAPLDDIKIEPVTPKFADWIDFDDDGEA